MPGYIHILRQADIFFKLSPDQLMMIADLCQEKTFQADDVIFPEGAKSDELYVIAQGEVAIQINPGLVSDQPQNHYAPVTISTLQRGQSFGEIALVDLGIRSATARAVQNGTRLLIIPRDQLIALCDAHPDLGYNLMHNLAADLALKMRSSGFLLREELLSESRNNRREPYI